MAGRGLALAVSWTLGWLGLSWAHLPWAMGTCQPGGRPPAHLLQFLGCFQVGLTRTQERPGAPAGRPWCPWHSEEQRTNRNKENARGTLRREHLPEIGSHKNPARLLHVTQEAANGKELTRPSSRSWSEPPGPGFCPLSPGLSDQVGWRLNGA